MSETKVCPHDQGLSVLGNGRIVCRKCRAVVHLTKSDLVDMVSNLRRALDCISDGFCRCAPERALDSEQPICASCQANIALGREDWGAPP